MNSETLKIRASAIGDIMTNPRTKSEMISKTAINAVNKAVIAAKYSRWDDTSSKFTEKGHANEEQALTMLSLHLKDLLFKNKTMFENGWITGTPDAWIEGRMGYVEHIYDVKSSWSIFTFTDAKGRSFIISKWLSSQSKDI